MRADWNINDHQKFMIRYNYTTQKKDNNLVGAALGIKGTPCKSLFHEFPEFHVARHERRTFSHSRIIQLFIKKHNKPNSR